MTRDEIEKRRDSAPSVRQYQRWQVIWLSMEQTPRAEEIARTVGVKQNTVYYWVYRYNNHGPEALILKQRGGARRRLLTDAQEQDILAPLTEKAARGEVVVINDIRTAVETTVGRKLGKGFPYRMAHRQKWRKKAPREEHPKKDPAAQETFKKNIQS
jgi:transposase